MWSQLAPYGPWAIAFGLVLFAFKDVVKSMLMKLLSSSESRNSDNDGAIKLALALDKLTSVLEHMERVQEKALDEILANQRDAAKVLQTIDYRTKEILDDMNKKG